MSEIKVQLMFPEATAEEIEAFSTQTIDVFRDEGIKINPVKLENLPDDVKTAAAFDWSNLIITLVASGSVLTGIISMLEKRLARFDNRSITIEIDGKKLTITGASDDTEKKLIREFIKWLPAKESAKS